ncbi:E-selectin-like [Melanotaenia boesemani]|uniref:E-selectin-like n=1 Tax=Melanotaenia boesemani TaxID=1250792 RepID=UPI001C05E352|nr:E-selectin-like [Melanotaenia boesemani]
MMKLRLRLWLFVLWLNVKTSLQQNDPTCEFGIIHSNLFVAGLPPQNQPITAGHNLRFLCSDEYKLKGSKEIECLQTGQWNSPFPTCSDPTCEVGVMDPRLFVSGFPLLNQPIQPGHKLRFQCNEESELRGSREIECLRTGQWNSPVPTCSGTSSCSGPPVLEYGESRSHFSHNERVAYRYQAYHIMEGEPYKTCKDGIWTGEMRCLKPCTVSQYDLDDNNIDFRRAVLDKLYSKHGDHVTFRLFKCPTNN